MPGRAQTRRHGWIRSVRLALRAALLALGVVVAYAVFLPLMRSTRGFLPYASDPRVRYEPGAEAMARVVAAALPEAIQAIEARHFRPFPQPAAVYVCASEKSFDRYGMSIHGAGGFVYGGRVFISPKPQNTAERLPRLLRHELSHLHLEQCTGMWWGTGHLPGWFREGLAVHASDGAGAENVSEAEAARAISAGRVFRRDGSGSYFRWQTPARDGLPPHLFYRESGMFVSYLAHRSPASFARFLQQIEDRHTLTNALESAFGADLPTLWNEFVAQLETG